MVVNVKVVLLQWKLPWKVNLTCTCSQKPSSFDKQLVQNTTPPVPTKPASANDIPCQHGMNIIISIIISIPIITYQHLQRGAKWFLKGINSPSLTFNWHPFEGPGMLSHHFEKKTYSQPQFRFTVNLRFAVQLRLLKAGGPGPPGPPELEVETEAPGAT